MHLHIFTETPFVAPLHPAQRSWVYVGPQKQQLGADVEKSHQAAPNYQNAWSCI